jgi:hypothetical protein
MKIFLSLLIGMILSASDNITLPPIIVDANSSSYISIPEYRDNEVDFSAIQTKMNIQQTAPGMNSPVIQGLQGELVGVKFEDVIMNNSNFRSGPNQYFSWIPNEFVDYKLESGNAIGLSVDSHLTDVSQIYTEYSSYDQGRKLIATEKYDNTTVGLKLYKTDDYNNIDHTAYNQNAIFIKNNTGNNTFIALYSTSSDIDRLDKYIQGKTYTYLDQNYIFIKDSYKLTSNDIFNISYQRFVENVDDNGNEIDSTNNVYGAKYIHNFDSGFNVKLMDSYEDLMYNQKDFTYNTTTAGIGYKNELDGIKLKTNIDGVWAQTTNRQNDVTKNFDTYSYNVELQKNIVYGSIRGGYKLPTANNLYYSITTGKGNDVPNNSLVPETSTTYSLGIKDVINYFTYNISGYYMHLDNAISSVKVGRISGVDQYQVQNVGNGIVKGVDATLTYDKDLFGSVFNFQYVYGKDDSDYMSKITPWKVYWKNEYNHYFVTWNYAHKGINLSASDMNDVRVINSAYNEYNNKGLNTFDVGYSNTYNKWLYGITLNNIFNNDGRVMGSAVDVPERSFTARLGYNF